MKLLSLRLIMPLLFASAMIASTPLSAQIINIAFDGFRGSESQPSNYSGGSGFANAGTYYDNIVADNSLSTDDISVTATDLLDSNQVATTAGFSITAVGADGPATNGIGVFNGSYLFTNSANNHTLAAPFTISGLGSATHENIIFFTSFDVPGIAVTFGGIAATPTSTVNPATIEFDNVAVVDGSIIGTVGGTGGNALILSGLAFEPSAAPEPSTYAMMLAGLAVLGFCVRRRLA